MSVHLNRCGGLLVGADVLRRVLAEMHSHASRYPQKAADEPNLLCSSSVLEVGFYCSKLPRAGYLHVQILIARCCARSRTDCGSSSVLRQPNVE